MLITVFGSGWVGLVTAAGLAEVGHRVLCVDVDADRVEGLRAGRVPFFEPGLAELVAQNGRTGRLAFATEIEPLFRESDVYFVAVGTPPGDGARADVSAVMAAAESAALAASRASVLAVKSTVPVGTCDEVAERVDALRPGLLRVASNPEFLKEGAALADFFRPDRVLLGVADDETERAMRDLYRPLYTSTDRIVVTDRRSAELAKYAANAMLATRISFMNELAQLCDRVGADVNQVRRAIGTDARIGPYFLHAGPGYGGSCFPKDVAALVAFARDAGVDLQVASAAARANDRQRRYVLHRIVSLFPDGAAGKRVALWGLAFKPETDDVREAPAGWIARALVELGAEVTAHDPQAAATFARAFGPAVRSFDDEYAAADGADALVLMTEWRKFRSPDFDDLRRRMRTPNLVDARNIWAPLRPHERGFRYVGIGASAGRTGDLVSEPQADESARP